MPGPVLWGPNNTSNNLQNQILSASGELMQNNGAKNYLNYNNFENGLTTGWSLGTTGTLTNAIPTGTPTFGSGVTNLTISVTSSNPIAGLNSLAYVASATTTAGNMLASDALPVDLGDRAAVLTYKFSYTVPSNPANGNFSGTSSNSFGVACYDVTNSAWLPVVGNFAMTQNSGAGIATGTMQTAINTASVRFVIYNANASAGAITLNFDRFFLGPQTAPTGPVVTDLGSIVTTTTGSWVTNTTYTNKLGLNGDRLVGNINLALTGAPTSATLTINLPFSIDTSKLSGGTASNQDLGEANIVCAGVGYFGKLRYNNATSVTVIYANPTFSPVTQAAPGTFGNGDTINCTIDIPIVGKSSNVQMSNDTDTRVVAARAYNNAQQTISTSATTKLSLQSVAYDTHGGFDTTNYRYVAPVSGYYRVTGNVYYVTVNASTVTLLLYKNGSVDSRLFGTSIPVAGTIVSGTSTLFLNAGQYVELFISNGSGSTSEVIDNGGGVYSYIEVERLSGPSVIAATESVNARYTNAAGSSVSTSFAIMPLPTKVYDSHNAMNVNGTYTVPVSGKYAIKAMATLTPTTLSATQQMQMAIYKNGSLYCNIDNLYGNASSNAYSVRGSDDVQCNAGDTLAVYLLSSVGTTLLTVADYNHVAITRIGN